MGWDDDFDRFAPMSVIGVHPRRAWKQTFVRLRSQYHFCFEVPVYGILPAENCEVRGLMSARDFPETKPYNQQGYNSESATRLFATY